MNKGNWMAVPPRVSTIHFGLADLLRERLILALYQHIVA